MLHPSIGLIKVAAVHALLHHVVDSCINPIKYIFEKPTLIEKIFIWQMLLFDFDIVFMTRKAIKDQAIANYLANQSLNDSNFSKSLFLDEDVLAI